MMLLLLLFRDVDCCVGVIVGDVVVVGSYVIVVSFAADVVVVSIVGVASRMRTFA